GSNAIDRLGGPASHGCVRLHPHHAAQLFALVQEEGPDKTTIEVTDEARPNEPSLPERDIAAGRGMYPPMPEREIAAGRGSYPPVPEVIRYREAAEMPEPPPARRGNRPIAAKNAGPPRLPLPLPPVAGRRMLSDARPATNAPRAPCGAGGDTANGSPRPSDESSDCRPKPRVAEAPSPPKPRVAEAPSPEHTQQAPSAYGFKLLPSSCWWGGASRWRWWASSQGTPCK
ncbi:MAG TPA: L,D-transpeptidase, partial [Bradyrhizobium sp.]|nr:L,D-transpeptidase [Bradyrhizobium sp.]